MRETGENILILACRPATARQWAAMLEGPGRRVWLGREEVPVEAQPDLLVTDLPEVSPDEVRDTGVLRIGPDGPADVCLPADCAPRELQTACRLLAQIVRLRRRARQADDLHRRLTIQALTDPLTGLPNRRAWDGALAERVAAAAASPRQLCLAILDLDHFKQINDVHGHVVGDEVLREAGRAVYDSLRQDDLVARLGGDEFGLLLWVPDESAAGVVVDRVRTVLPSRLSQTAPYRVTASAGYCIAPRRSAPPLPSADALYAAADAALHEAKRRGRNRTVGGKG